MSYIVEDGSGVTDANSYVTAEDATAYLSVYEAAGFADWPTDPDDQEAALLVGAQALELNYRDKFASCRCAPTANDLSWPRDPFYDRSGALIDGTIPNSVKYAQATLALYYLQDVDVFPQEAKDRFITSQSDRVGDLSTSTSYIPGAPFEIFPKVTRLLWNVCRSQQVSMLLR